MSGTAAGTIVLHVTPESAIGGPLGLVQNGDCIRLSLKERSLSLLVDDVALAARQTSRATHTPAAERGYRKLFLESVLQADEGADFGFLQAETMHTVIPLPRS
jgi:dihydroxy-acid dehydratase